MKKIGIMTTGGDCSGLNTAIERIVRGGRLRGWRVFGICDGTDGLMDVPANVFEFNADTLPIEEARLAGSFLRNGHAGKTTFENAAQQGNLTGYNKKLRNAIARLGLDGLILIGGNGSLSLAWQYREIYADTSLVCIPKTIDMDIPLTDRTIGFDTAVQQLVGFCDQLMLTARSHHRWFVVQAMGRDCGNLALNAGVAVGASAILIPEIKFDVDGLISHIKKSESDYGVSIVSEGISLRGPSGRPADMISRRLAAAGIANRAAFPEHTQRAGDTVASDRILAASMADCALRAIENGETYVMTVMRCGECETIPLSEFFAAGDIMPDPNIRGVSTSNAYVSPDNPLLTVAADMGIYMGEMK